ncbi:MAG: DUF3575 domain-containing protein [Bacteroidales bacterium]|jgi:hypothetical protein|nr:DUF3575 domain-containing protein [Bacteroidales bacterium]MCI2121364.1 DUF3575 domain-containing protein [Bacteroidales bacterium]MCI2145235.1 DUF3575 domain-containing protein [Bacteroidales bacterium]
MKKIILTLALIAAASFGASAQHLAVKTNTLGWLTTTPNLGVEIGMGQFMTLDVDGAYNPFRFKDEKRIEGWAIQPELRYWFDYKYSGQFIGLNGQHMDYDAGLNKYNYLGNMYGVGISYGFAFPMSPRWRLELNIGAGWTRWNCKVSDRYYNFTRNDAVEGVIIYDPIVNKDIFGITRLGVTFTYLIF